jgi:2-phospho-L-lactate guanylyltransferase (CobY/MobA/RfbA family)
MRLVCAGVANGISHTTSGEPTTSTVVLDRVTGQPIVLFGVGGGVVRSVMSLFAGDLRRFPPCVVVLSPSVMTYVDLPVYLRLMTLQNVRVTVMAPAAVLDAVVQYIEDVLAEEDAAVGIAVQRMTQFVDLETDVPVVLPTKIPNAASTRRHANSSVVVAPGGGGVLLGAMGAKDIQSSFDDVVLSQWLLFLQSSKSPVREDHCLFNAVLVHRRVVIDGANKHKDAVAAALTTAMSAAGTLNAADGVIKEDSTTMLAIVGHLPPSLAATSAGNQTTDDVPATTTPSTPHDTAAMMFLLQCDAIVTTMQDEALLRSACSAAAAASAEAARSSSTSARARSNPGTPPPNHLDAPPGSVSLPPVSTMEGKQEPSLILTRFAAHEPPLTFHPKTFVAQRGIEYRITPHEGVVQLGVLQGHQGRTGGHNGATSKNATQLLTSSPLGAKFVDEDLEDSDDSGEDRVDGALRRQVAAQEDYQLSGVNSHTIGALRQEQQARRIAAAAQQSAAPQHLDHHKHGDNGEAPPNAFAMSLRAEHYDAEMSQLAEMRRQLGVPYVADSAVPVNWGSMGAAFDVKADHHRHIGRHTAARVAARRYSSTGGASSPAADSRRQPRASSQQQAPGVPNSLIKPPPPSRHYRCTFFFDAGSPTPHQHSSAASFYECDLLQPGDPMQCTPLSIDAACQGRTSVLHQYLSQQVEGAGRGERLLKALCVDVLRAIQFSVAMIRVTQSMAREDFVAVESVRTAVDGTWLSHLQELLNEAVYSVLAAQDDSAAVLVHNNPSHHRRAGPTHPRRGDEVVDADGTTPASAVLHRVLKAVRSASERWVRWLTMERMPLVDFVPFARSYDEDRGTDAEFNIIVALHD